MAEDQGELFTGGNLGDGRYRTVAQRRRAIARIIRGWEKGDRGRRETKAEHDHCEAGGTVYQKSAFREV